MPPFLCCCCGACGLVFTVFLSRQAKINAEAVLGRVVGAITGKKEGENVVDITTTIDLLQVFWEAEKARNKISESDVKTLSAVEQG